MYLDLVVCVSGFGSRSFSVWVWCFGFLSQDVFLGLGAWVCVSGFALQEFGMWVWV